MATIKDVAKRSGVSVATVSRVLNNTAPVNYKTKETIMKAIEELNYKPNIIAQGMRTKKSKTIGITIPDYINPFYYELFKYIEDAAKKEGYHVIVSSTGEDINEDINCIDDLINRNIDGLIICTYRGDKETIKYLLELSKKIPIIFMDNLQLDKPVNSVYTDGYKGMKEITKHLISLGHKNIGFVKSIAKYKVANDRFYGYKDALIEAGIEFRDELVYEGNYHIQSGYEAAKYFFTDKKLNPSAIVSSTDLMAIGAMNYIKTIGLRIPEDVAIAGFDDIYMSRLISPPLTTYRQPIEEIAKEAINLFINKVNHPNAKNRTIVLNGEMVIRRSTDILRNEIERI
ncbi:LacI family DNA-binding transcriptional regulator [Caloramator sp. E03]|uniref:LacI family DNA-binding transcriptional regulator n=1 Tax=Caloramator sp. E03 TaxID=2576307 RepID=UPI00143DD8D4|nr:LacI family DNA-binding transcriptional regulator [Caloramator sp. E03]